MLRHCLLNKKTGIDVSFDHFFCFYRICLLTSDHYCVCCLFHRLSYVFVIGKGNKPWISLPRGKGVKLTIAEERDRRLAAKTQ